MKIKYRMFSGIGRRAHMEDTVSVIAKNGGDSLVAIICDGHGPCGGEAAESVKDRFEQLFCSYQPYGFREIRGLFASSHREMKKNYGGTTGVAVTVLRVNGRQACVNNVGDAEVRHIMHDPIIGPHYTVVSETHRLSNPYEKERIQKVWSDFSHNHIIVGDQGLELTRSIGDMHFSKAGVCCRVASRKATLNRGSLIIAATDGCWDVLDYRSRLYALPKTALSCGKEIQRLCKRYAEDNYAGIVLQMD